MLPIRNVAYTKCYLDEMVLYEKVLYEMLLYENVLYEMLLIHAREMVNIDNIINQQRTKFLVHICLIFVICGWSQINIRKDCQSGSHSNFLYYYRVAHET